jgi:hypothetical protein
MFRLRGSFRLLHNAVLWRAHALSVSFFSCSLFSAQRSVLWRLLLLFTALLVFKTPAGIRLTEKITGAMTHLLC